MRVVAGSQAGWAGREPGGAYPPHHALAPPRQSLPHPHTQPAHLALPAALVPLLRRQLGLHDWMVLVLLLPPDALPQRLQAGPPILIDLSKHGVCTLLPILFALHVALLAKQRHIVPPAGARCKGRRQGAASWCWREWGRLVCWRGWNWGPPAKLCQLYRAAHIAQHSTAGTARTRGMACRCRLPS